MELLANLSAYKMQVHTQPVPTSLSLQSSELKTYPQNSIIEINPTLIDCLPIKLKSR